MLNEGFRAVMVASLAGSLLAVLITLVKPVTKRIFGYLWHYYIWLTVLFVMLAPIRIAIPQRPAADMQAVQVNMAAAVPSGGPAAGLLSSVTAYCQKYLCVIWVLGMIFFALIHIIGYFRLCMRVRKNSAAIICPRLSAYTNKKILVRSGRKLSSPFIFGIFRPTLVLPEAKLSAEQLDNILRHEITHFKRKDILYKWFAVVVRCVHWFNPFAHYVAGQIRRECEISCDLSVTSSMNRRERQSYVDTILLLASGERVKRVPLTTQMADSKAALERRFKMIKNFRKKSRIISAVSVVIGTAMLTATAFASGVANDLTAGRAAVASGRRAAEFTPATPGAAALTAAGQEGLPNCDISITVKDDTMLERFAQYQDQYQNFGIEYDEGKVLINTELIKSLEYQGADATLSFTAPADGKNTVKFQQGTDGSSAFSVYDQDGKLISASSDNK